MNATSRPRAGFFFADPARISLALAALLAALPFLFPEHRPPLRSFYDEWVGAGLATLAIVAFLPAWRSNRDAVPDLSVWLVLFAGWLGLQAVLRPPAYVQLPIAGVAYVLLAAQLAWLGHALAARFGAERVVDVLAWALVAGALANAVIGILQFYGVPRFLSGFIGTNSGPRIVGHVGQANLFAEYVALGQAALLYLVARGLLRGNWWWGAAALLVLSSAYTQSRSAILFSLWIFLLAFSLRYRGPPWRRLALHAGILALATLVAMALTRVSAFDRFSGMAGEPRLALWALAWRLFAGSPWLGVGWGEFAGAAFSAGLAPPLQIPGAVWTSAHNIVLQLLAETGLIGAAVVLIAALHWWAKAWTDLRGSPTLPQWWIVAAAGAISLHALLEEQLWYAHVLCLAALIAGIASGATLKLSTLPMRAGLAAASLAALVALAWSLFDYQRFDRAYVVATGRTLATAEEVSAALRDLRAAASGPLGAQVAPWLYLSLPPGEDPAAALAMGERVMRRWPSSKVVARQAELLERSRVPSAPSSAPPRPRVRRERRAAPRRPLPAARAPMRRRAGP